MSLRSRLTADTLIIGGAALLFAFSGAVSLVAWMLGSTGLVEEMRQGIPAFGVLAGICIMATAGTLLSLLLKKKNRQPGS